MDINKTRIGIIGIGGVGGFIGAPLASYYTNDKAVEIVFICRGKILENIKSKGLTFKTGNQEISVRPDITSDNIQEIGVLDVLFITTKSYALRSVVEVYEPVIKKDTVIIPLQNMVNAKEVIRTAIPNKGKILEGCIYVASNIKAPGYVEHKGGPGKVFIGGDTADDYKWLVDLLSKGGVDITFCENIKEALWSKYLFVSPVAAVTTAYHKTFGDLLNDKNLLALLKAMMLEVKALSVALGIHLTDDLIEKSIDLLHKFPYEAKSSLQLDFEQHRKNEKEYLVDYVIEKSKEKGIQAIHYQEVSKKISAVNKG